MTQDHTNFYDQIDSDSGLQSKRKSLIVLSSILIAIYWTGASIKEFSGLIATIEVQNTLAVHHLLVISIIYMMLRYFAYARVYHQKLRSFWVSRFLADERVFEYNRFSEQEDDVKGLIGKIYDANSIWIGDYPGLANPDYIRSYFIGRKITYIDEWHAPIDQDEYEIIKSTEEISLTKFNENWTFKDYVHLLSIELKYVVNSYSHYREYFDLIGPYIFGLIAITPYLLIYTSEVFSYISLHTEIVKSSFFSLNQYLESLYNTTQ